MSAAAYLTSCPHCGAQLAPVALTPDCAPWLCSGCRLGFWVAELTTEARLAWDKATRSHKWHTRRQIIEPALAVEIAAAAQRGTSALPEHLPLLPLAQLQALAGQVKGSAFAAQVAAAVKAKGGS